ncbi:inositol monophosphatase family protein [Ruegeria atlantica]|uniref:ADP-ribosyl-[dinitrogen reductase] glycohydrolase n=1 Tax=Ruegeria atlantica TaxID=81569 RepID=A0A0P1EAL4_9RHOB|nr:inositol monophosphatase family protein [Ruegeria atlantica]CUH46409.1 ADP-ribosyl-[dinitrogen reductase] glycohydrolase [Ruegeria atlantica]
MSSDTQSFAAILPQVITAVETVGAMIRAEFHRPGGPRGTSHKAAVDTEAELFLKNELMSLHPASWLGEETDSCEVDCSDIWIVDPHDGTADFMNGLRGSAVSVALLSEGRPVLGVVYAPTAPDDSGDMISWALGAELIRNGRAVEPEPTSGNPVIALNADAANYALPNHISFGGARVRPLPSPAYRAALAAVGEVDAAISLVQGLSSWDIAGGHALLIGAGKAMVQLDGQELNYASNWFQGFIAGSADIVCRLSSVQVSSSGRIDRKPAVPSTRTGSAPLLSRAHGTMLGQLAGDALGSFVEFLDPQTILDRHPEGVVELRDGGTWNLISGQPTDDSEMALALARSICARKRYVSNDVAQAYIDWRNSGPFDIGHTTSSAISALEAGELVQSESQANGALMRACPIGIFSVGNPKLAALLARQDASLTHPNSITMAANAAYVAAISVGVAGGEEEEMWAAAYSHAGEDEGADMVRNRLLAARSNRPQDFQHQMGWALTAFQNAFFCLMSEQTLRDAVVGTVAFGGDTDTNGAICGALLGARQGRDAVPLQWRNSVLSCRPVAAVGVHHPRPQAYWPDNVLELSEALLVARTIK